LKDEGTADPGVSARLLLVFGAACALASVILGAAAAHALEGRLTAAELEVIDTAVRYQALHALAVLVTGTLCALRGNLWLHAAGWLFLAGILLFSGSLYVKLLAGVPSVGAVTPLGGVTLMAGWVSLCAGGWRLRPA
jgi:uncharacterized membrane protein YgdD (TMEM256/DUF423 family)